MMFTKPLQQRLRASAAHLAISLAIAAMVAAVVFGLWYPGAYRLMAGGRELFLLVTAVDVVLGPLLTLAVFDIRKGWPHLRRDLTVIAILQIAALGYGLHTVFEARPVLLVFEVDRFRVLNTAQLELSELPRARPEYKRLPLTGPWLIGTRKSTPGADRDDAIFKGIDGIDIGQRPTFWQPYSESVAQAQARARPAALLLKQYPARAREVNRALSELKMSASEAKFLPVMARGDWVTLLNANGMPVVFLPLDGFF
jgi:hypothetical protein